MFSLIDRETSNYDHTFKRLFFDGTCTGNISLGLVKRDLRPIDRLRQILGMSVRVGDKDPRPLVTIGDALATRFLESTTKHADEATINRGVVESGDPLVVCEFGGEGGFEATEVVGRNPPVLDWPVLRIFHGDLFVEGIQVPVWLLARREVVDGDALRLRDLLCKAVRNLLISRHSERVALGSTLRAMRRGEIDGPENRHLTRFLPAALEKLMARPDEAVVTDLRADPSKGARATYAVLHDLALATVLSSEAAVMERDDELAELSIELMREYGFSAESVARAERALAGARGEPPPTSTAVNREKRLHELLLTLFGAEELRRFLSLEFPDVVSELPGTGASAQDLAYSGMMAVLRREGRVDKLFAALRDARPARAESIQAVEVLWRDG